MVLGKTSRILHARCTAFSKPLVDNLGHNTVAYQMKYLIYKSYMVIWMTMENWQIMSLFSAKILLYLIRLALILIKCVRECSEP